MKSQIDLDFYRKMFILSIERTMGESPRHIIFGIFTALRRLTPSFFQQGGVFLGVIMENPELFSIVKTTKRCTRCKKELPFDQFTKDKSRRDGLQCHCKKCINEYKKEYRKRPERKAIRQTEKYKEYHKEYLKEYRKGDKWIEKRNTYRKTYLQSEKGKEWIKAYYQSEKCRFSSIQNHTNRHRLIENSINDLTLEQWESIKKSFGYRCAYCQVEFTQDNPATQDHIIPLSRGGHHTADNIVPACRSCNSKKKAKLLPSKTHKIDIFSGLFVTKGTL